MEQKKLDEILRLHKMWLNGEEEGERAVLRGADLRDANLQGAALQGADLQGADLRYANLRDANLRDANLRGAALRYADLRDANLQGAALQGAALQGAALQGAVLRGANLDYSCWPLWCGSLDVKVDRRIAAQLAYHFCRLDCDDPDYIEARNAIVNFANEFHRVEECGWLELKEVNPVG